MAGNIISSQTGMGKYVIGFLDTMKMNQRPHGMNVSQMAA